MRGLAYALLAIALFSLITWATVYSRDNSTFVARGSTPFDIREFELGLWLIEGSTTFSIFIPECYSVHLVVYSKGGGLIVYEDRDLKGPLRDTKTIMIPYPGYYIFKIRPKILEGCREPITGGSLNVYQYAQAEKKIRNILLITTAIPGITGLALIVRQLTAKE